MKKNCLFYIDLHSVIVRLTNTAMGETGMFCFVFAQKGKEMKVRSSCSCSILIKHLEIHTTRRNILQNERVQLGTKTIEIT